MNLELTEAQKAIQTTAREFAQAELEPVAAQLDREFDRRVFVANLKKLADLGLTGLEVKREHGGSEAGAIAFSVAMTEIGRVCASTATTLVLNDMVAEVIQDIGTPEQKALHLPRLCAGEYPAASFALTEAGAGSDAAAVATTAVPDGDGWILNGAKRFTMNAPFAGVFLVWAVTDRAAPKGKGMSCFLVEAGTRGLRVGRTEDKLGQRATATTELAFHDCRVPRGALVGRLNDGFRMAVTELARARIGIASLALGIGLSAMDFATRYASRRVQFDDSLTALQGVQWMIADAYTDLEAARLLLLSAAWRKERGQPFVKAASMAKLFATDAANRACYTAMQLMGGAGYTRAYPVERYARDARLTSIYAGANELQRVIIAGEILKELA
ncbi:acyl-CoA dehydrogenase family protein [Anaeromyxobacter sp. SG64]|uniref:acyl-CoA dehydrogenase family protein n=1 Tax=Anaeromyxobacter sp. SG64 TaxID=2925409 RepID=UPI001F5871A4|nr:acyl-CoA dehydrogenase family protein [Anaeromyxobacter sp. SG64]